MQEKLNQIKHYIENYEKSKNDSILNYYRIFELLETSTIETLLNDIKNKKLKILFHPDLLAYIPEQNKQSFKVLSDAVKDMENIFSSIRNKGIYDLQLKRSYLQQSTTRTQQFSKTSDLEKFNSIIKTNVEKYGFKFTGEALDMIIRHNNFNGITKTNASRTKADILGKKKIETILNFFAPKNAKNPSLNSKVINYYSYLIQNNPDFKKIYDTYINACETTLLKHGIEQLSFAIKENLNDVYYKSDETKFYTRFTNENNSRTNLREQVKPEDLIILSRIYLNINQKEKYQENDLATLTDQQIISEFSNVLNENINKQTNHHHR